MKHPVLFVILGKYREVCDKKKKEEEEDDWQAVVTEGVGQMVPRV